MLFSHCLMVWVVGVLATSLYECSSFSKLQSACNDILQVYASMTMRYNETDLYWTDMHIYTFIYIYGAVSRVATPPPPPPWYGSPPPPPIPHTFCTRHCSETYISILLHARRCSETHIFILLDEPSRRIRWVDRAKLWRNANFKLQEWLRAVYRTLQCSANGIIYIYISMYIHIHKHQ